MYKLPSEAVAWLQDLQHALETQPHDRCELLLNVPFTHLSGMVAARRGDTPALGAQDLSSHTEGAYTGEIAGAMLRDVGATYVIVGHSERRAYHHENDAVVATKVQAAAAAGLTPILCVGESESERDAGQADIVVLRQLDAALANSSLTSPDDLVLAYEPIWAIGTGKTATAEDAQAMAATIRAALVTRFPSFGAGIRVLYGGSMKPANAAELLSKPDIDGGLIGGASLEVESLIAIVAAAQAASPAALAGDSAQEEER